MKNEHNLKKNVSDFVVPTNAIVNVNQTIEEAIGVLREKHIDESIVYIYVVDGEGKLCGVVSTRNLLLKDPSTKLHSIMNHSVISIPAEKTLKEAMEFLESHKLLALPVVSDEERLIGIIDVNLYVEESIEFVNERRNTDIFQLMGVYLEEGRVFKLWKRYKNRMPWMFCNMAGGLSCAVISRVFELVLTKLIVLAMFIPLVLTLSESISMQSMTLSLEYTRRKFRLSSAIQNIFQETKVVALIAVTSGVVVGLISLLWQEGAMASFVIGSGILISVFISSIFGAVIPVLLHYLKWDPKVAAGPVVLMFADVVTTAIYLSLGSAVLSL